MNAEDLDHDVDIDDLGDNNLADDSEPENVNPPHRFKDSLCQANLMVVERMFYFSGGEEVSCSVAVETDVTESPNRPVSSRYSLWI